MILAPCITEPSERDDAETDDVGPHIPEHGVTAISKIEDTIELIAQNEDVKAPVKVGKWHEKFARSRVEKKG